MLHLGMGLLKNRRVFTLALAPRPHADAGEAVIRRPKLLTATATCLGVLRKFEGDERVDS
jgi:hypothetical protein